MNEKSIFTKIIERDIPAEILYESESVIIVLDIGPITDGHCLVIPKVQVDQFMNLDQEVLIEVMRGVQMISKKLKSTFDCSRVGVVIDGYQVPHAHVHVFPTYQPGDIPEAKTSHSKPPLLALQKVSELLTT